MKYTLASLALAALLALAGCAQLEAIAGTKVPVTQIMAAASGVDAAEIAATSYIRFCTPNPAPAGCDDAVIQTKLIPAVKSLRDARNAAEAFVKDNPDATLGPATLIDAINKADQALSAIEADLNIKGAA